MDVLEVQLSVCGDMNKKDTKVYDGWNMTYFAVGIEVLQFGTSPNHFVEFVMQWYPKALLVNIFSIFMKN